MTETSSPIEILRHCPMFAGIAPPTLEAIAAVALSRTIDEGDALYHLGDDALEVFVVGDGRVRFTLGVGNRPGGAGSILSAGQVFGWAALLEDQPRRLATALCLEPTRVLAIDGKRLLTVFDDDAGAGYQFMRRLAAMIAQNLMDVLAA